MSQEPEKVFSIVKDSLIPIRRHLSCNPGLQDTHELAKMIERAISQIEAALMSQREWKPQDTVGDCVCRHTHKEGLDIHHLVTFHQLRPEVQAALMSQPDEKCPKCGRPTMLNKAGDALFCQPPGCDWFREISPPPAPPIAQDTMRECELDRWASLTKEERVVLQKWASGEMFWKWDKLMEQVRLARHLENCGEYEKVAFEKILNWMIKTDKQDFERLPIHKCQESALKAHTTGQQEAALREALELLKIASGPEHELWCLLGKHPSEMVGGGNPCKGCDFRNRKEALSTPATQERDGN